MTTNAEPPSGFDLLQMIKEGTLPPPGIASFFGLAMDVLERGRVVFSLDADERVHNPLGGIHGGAIATIADSAMACAVQSVLDPGVVHTSLDLNLHFVKSAQRGRILADAHVLHAGGRIATAECRVTTAEGTLLAHGSSTCLILRPPK